MFKKIQFLFAISFLFSQYNYSLEDINPSSAFLGQQIGPSFFEGYVTLHYFGYFTWGTCTNRFGQLNNLYENLKSQGHNVELVGISNGSASSSSSGNWTSNNDSPVCVDGSDEEVWTAWSASQRDLFILDLDGNLVLQQNITSGIPDNLDSLIINLLIPSGPEPCNLDDIYVSEAHTSGDPEDYIEIYNNGNVSCSLEGFKLDDNQEMDDLTFGNVVIAAGGFWLGYKDEDSSFNSGLSSSGDEVWLADPLGNLKMVSLNSSVEVNGVQLSQSFNSVGDGCYTDPTPGQLNSDCITLEIENPNIIPTKISTINNYPNPFNPSTNIILDLINDEELSILVYDINGNLVKSIYSGFLDRGNHMFVWEGNNSRGKRVVSGIYFCVLRLGNEILSKKMILSK